MTAAEFRRLALGLPGVEEGAHMEHPDFRVGGRIFATLGYPDEAWAMVKIFPDQQQAFCAANPAAFVPVKGGWGRQGCTNVQLRLATEPTVQEALAAAWQKAAPARQVSPKRKAP